MSKFNPTRPLITLKLNQSTRPSRVVCFFVPTKVVDQHCRALSQESMGLESWVPEQFWDYCQFHVSKCTEIQPFSSSKSRITLRCTVSEIAVRHWAQNCTNSLLLLPNTWSINQSLLSPHTSVLRPILATILALNHWFNQSILVIVFDKFEWLCGKIIFFMFFSLEVGYSPVY